MCQVKKRGKKKKIRIANILTALWIDYFKAPKEPITKDQFKAVNQIIACRTPALGTDIYCCPTCRETKHVYHSCKNRFCPTCGYNETNRWAGNILSQLIDCKHHHIVFTLPAALRPLAKDNSKIIYNILFKSSAETLIDWFKAKYGITPGIISVEHTAGEDLKYHLHVHMVCTAGGIKNGTEEFFHTKDNYLVRIEFLKKSFRWHFENLLIKAFDKEELQHPYKSRQEFMKFIKQLNTKAWVISIQKALKDPESIVRYVCRYTKRACLSEHKIKSFDGEYISFEYKDYRDRNKDGKPKFKIITLHYRDFFPRLLQHVPMKNFRMIRYYGVYHRIKKIPEKLKQQKTKQQDQYPDTEPWHELQLKKTGTDPLICEKCKKNMILIETVFDTRIRRWLSADKFKIPDFYDTDNRNNGYEHKRKHVA